MILTEFQTSPKQYVWLDWLMGKLNGVNYPTIQTSEDPGPVGNVNNKLLTFNYGGRTFSCDFFKASQFPDSALCSVANEFKISIPFEYYHPVVDPTPVVKTPIGRPDPAIPGAFFTSIYDTSYTEAEGNNKYVDGNNVYIKKLISYNIFVPNYRWILQGAEKDEAIQVTRLRRDINI